jgi:hypothetical protein
VIDPAPCVTAPTRIGIIVNRRSHAGERSRAGLDAMQASDPDLSVAAPCDRAALQEALRRFAAEGVGLLVVSGGDGTVRDVLSALSDAYPGTWPDLAILPAGNTNLAARALGSAGTGAGALARLLAAARSGRLRYRSCPVLQVSWIGQPERPVLRGFLLGAAAMVDAKRLADAEVHRRGLHRGLAVLTTIALTAVRALAGKGRLRGGTTMRIGLDDGPPVEGNRFLLLATTLDRLLFGLWPFWGKGTGAIHLLDIDAPARRLMAALFAVWLWRPRPWMLQEGYRSARAGRIRLQLEQPFVLDGDQFDPGPDGVLLSAPASIRVAFQ